MTRHLREIAVALALVVALGLVVAGRGESSADDGNASGNAPGRALTASIPAQIDPRPQTFVSAEVQSPVTNAWRAGSRESFTEGSAGALAGDRSTGVLAVFRHDYLAATQGVNLVEVDGSGPVRITKAPLGKGVEESAQDSGKIEFAGAHGVRGTLDLSDDSVMLETG
jgi:hypothetical protein